MDEKGCKRISLGPDSPSTRDGELTFMDSGHIIFTEDIGLCFIGSETTQILTLDNG
ncbi:hypothetical protein DCAR_0102017 [Daucus carota subsp. sativus]|uniref:Uncharacterized protein n=1 Tax=Daucus carota subsp. sativus TaxID=79200 RepID=A0A175YLR5_DAUCS|nr:hypothetical protein DCAR_0102017 [Daucus carota subsp. sativus]